VERGLDYHDHAVGKSSIGAFALSEGRSYQAGQASEALAQPYLFWKNFEVHLKTFRLYFLGFWLL